MCPASRQTLSSFIFDDKQSRANYYLTQCRHYVARDVVNSTHSIELMIDNSIELTIEIDQGPRLIVIDREPIADRILLIVIALNQCLTGLVIHARLGGRVVLHMVNTA